MAAYGTRSQTSLNPLLLNDSIRSYTLIIDGQEFPGVVMMGKGNIFFKELKSTHTTLESKLRLH